MRAPSVCLFACGTLLLGTNLRADPISSLYMVGTFTNMPTSSQNYTNSTVLTPSQTIAGTSELDAFGDTLSYSSSYSAYLSFGHLGLDVSSSDSVNNPFIYPSAGPAAGATAISWDEVNVGGVSTGFLRLYYQVDGQLNYTPDLYGSAEFGYLLSENNLFYADVPGRVWDTVDLTGSSAPQIDGNGSFAADGSYSDSGYVDLAFSGGSVFIYQELSAQAQCYSSVSNSCSASASFMNTALVGGAVVLDASGNVVQGATITSASGHDYTQPINAGSAQGVPEPGSWCLLPLLLLAMLVLSRRRSVARP